ncbi:MAG: putative nucleotidyltransferase [uncultured marine phage]|uniref:Putative nucleotidyltransferase n=1 Tax=uncultured marine phage TaxID=707152 RepID=A0A8D9C911_9VIRU|nr:MAG: putative nucleotidyltransferase [uncultured marine phage]
MVKYDIVIVSGGFDPVHKGHVRMFKESKLLGHKVICGANSDQWLCDKKGKNFMEFSERKEILEAFEYVDEVLSFDDSDGSAIGLISKVFYLYPDTKIAFANGGDRNSTNIPEKKFCDDNNIDMIWDIGGGKVQSSSDLLSKA